MLDARTVQILRNATILVIKEVEAHSDLIVFCAGNARQSKRNLEDAVEIAERELIAAAKAQVAAKKGPDDEDLDEEDEPPMIEPKKEPSTNREKIAEAIEEMAASGVPNA